MLTGDGRHGKLAKQCSTRPTSFNDRSGGMFPKGTIERTVTMFAVLLMTTPFAVFLLAGIQKS
jgi:hypothetical protein